MTTFIKLETVNDIKKFVNFAAMHEGDVALRSGKYVVDGKSIMGLFSLDLTTPTILEIEGDVSDVVINGIKEFFVG